MDREGLYRVGVLLQRSKYGTQEVGARMACACSSFRDAWLGEARMLDLTPTLCGGLMLRALTEAGRYVRWRSILKAASAMGGLRRLSLAGCRLSSNESVLVAEVLIENPGLRFLDLKGNDLGGRGCRTLGLALGFHQGLAVLDLEGNSIGTEGATVLARGLRNSETWGICLRSLDLSANHIRMEGVVLLAAALSENTTLQHLVLSKNYIHAEGARYLAEALCGNASILSLDLSDNYLFSEGAEEMGHMLVHNATLEQLDLSVNYINDRGYEALRTGLRENATLQRLILKSNYISTELRETAEGELVFDGLVDDEENASNGLAMQPQASGTSEDWRNLDDPREWMPPLASLSLEWRSETADGTDGRRDTEVPSLVWRDAPAGTAEADEVHDVLWTPRGNMENY